MEKVQQVERVEQVEQVQKEIQALAREIPKTIQSEEEYATGARMVVSIRKEIKARKEWFQEFLAPVKRAKEEAVKALKAQEAKRDEILRPLMEADKTLRVALSDWSAAEEQRRLKEQERLNKLHEKRVNRAVSSGKDVSAVKPPSFVPPVPKSVKSEEGSFTVRTHKELSITDEKLIPDLYFDRIRNDQRIMEALKSGIEVPGATLVERAIPAVRLS